MADKRLRLIVEAVTSQAQAAIRSFGNQLRGFGDDASRNLEKPTKAAQTMGGELGTLAMAATVALATVGIQFAKMAASAMFSMAEMAAKNLELGEGFRMVAARMGIEANKFVEALQAAARGTIGQYQTMLLATKALDLGIGASVDDLVKLMEIAHVRAKRYGMSTAEAFELLINGISSGRPMMLRHLGFLADTEKAYDAYAHSIGKTADEMTLLEQKQAVYQAILQTGIPDIEAWVSTADDASDAFERQRIATQKLRQEIGEMLLPTMNDLAERMSTLPTILDQLGYIFGVTIAGMSAGFGTLGELIRAGDWGAILRGEAIDAYEAAESAYAVQDAARKANAEWGQMYQVSAQARKGLLDVGAASEETATDLDALAKAQKQGADIMADYARSVAQLNWQFAQSVSNALFSAVQAAENAAFDLYKIQRDAADRTSDLMADMAIRNEADTARHYAELRRMKQDLNDSLADIEWNYQQERKEVMDQAPWWVRNALSKEFAERERIAKTGDKKALEEYDKVLLARIKAIDPAYAKELELLLKQHKHEEAIEKREAKQAAERKKEDWEIDQREQAQALAQQLFELARGLGYQLDEWGFHDTQRLEGEKQSMANLIIEHEHSLSTLWEITQRKLADIAALWEVYGREAMQRWITGMDSVPWPTKEEGPSLKGEGYQQGLEYVPRTMPVVVHKGESILPAGKAAQYRQGGAITINLTVGGGWSPYQGQQIAAQIATELGRGIRRSYR